jgi:hypothetical protein
MPGCRRLPCFRFRRGRLARLNSRDLAEQCVDPVAGSFCRGQSRCDRLAQLHHRGAAWCGLACKLQQRRHLQPPEQLLIKLTDQIEMALRLVNAALSSTTLMRAATRQPSSPSNPSAQRPGKRLAQAQPVKQIQGHALRVLRIDGFGQQLQRAPAEHRVPTWPWRELRTGAGQHAAGGAVQGAGKSASWRECAWPRADACGKPRGQKPPGSVGNVAANGDLFRKTRSVGRLRRAQEASQRPGLLEELTALPLDFLVGRVGAMARGCSARSAKQAHDARIELQAERVVHGRSSRLTSASSRLGTPRPLS